MSERERFKKKKNSLLLTALAAFPAGRSPLLRPLQPHTVWTGASGLLLLHGAGIPRCSRLPSGRRGAGVRDFTAAKAAEVDHYAVSEARLSTASLNDLAFMKPFQKQKQKTSLRNIDPDDPDVGTPCSVREKGGG